MTYVILLENKGNCLKHHIKILYHMSHCHLGPTFQNSTTLSQTTVQLFGPSCFHPWSQFLLTSLLKMPLLPSVCFNLFWPQWPDVLLNLAITAPPKNIKNYEESQESQFLLNFTFSHLPIANRPNKLFPLKGPLHPPTLRAAFVSGGLMSICSGIPIAIGGTDLNPAVFYGDFVVAIANVAGPWGDDHRRPRNG